MNLQDKTVLFLGSSVTYGYAAGGISFADIMSEVIGINCIKEAVSGTTLADVDNESYVARLKSVNKKLKIDLCICQLSTNDVWRKIDISEIEKAICFILEYTKETFCCPIVFYTGTYFESELYVKMIELLYDLQNKYEFYILDLYNDKDMLTVGKENYERYMQDPVHPTIIGYREWWTPKFIEFCEKLP